MIENSLKYIKIITTTVVLNIVRLINIVLAGSLGNKMLVYMDDI